ncbi:hypothetical protein EVAR_75461_1 [Eumeta japonica]|uniref:Uncharacterized protein n=1 Tax=Eumeta variegata TaxID=151549 RepID=A0A4C1TMK9_EUMVA|nr:hypothetical protein EVAR_75461_1 [Eumeta japonica]
MCALSAVRLSGRDKNTPCPKTTQSEGDRPELCRTTVEPASGAPSRPFVTLLSSHYLPNANRDSCIFPNNIRAGGGLDSAHENAIIWPRTNQNEINIGYFCRSRPYQTGAAGQRGNNGKSCFPRSDVYADKMITRIRYADRRPQIRTIPGEDKSVPDYVSSPNHMRR